MYVLFQGCQINPRLAFKYLQKAASSAVDDINMLNSVNLSATKGELVLAIYELGVCFRHGWGVPKDKVHAAHYFEMAAKLVGRGRQREGRESR